MKIRGNDNINAKEIKITVSDNSIAILGNKNNIHNCIEVNFTIKDDQFSEISSSKALTYSEEDLNDQASAENRICKHLAKQLKNDHGINIGEDELHDAVRSGFQEFVQKNTGSSIMAKNILGSCPEGNQDYITEVKKFAKKAKVEYQVFLSAITKRKGTNKNTLEYEIACEVKKALNKKNINVFWWEDKGVKDKSDWKISTKIAMGLAFSSVFVGIAFDSVSKNKNGEWVYNCLLDNNEAYKTPAFFKYEVDTYSNFIRNKDSLNAFVKGIVDESSYSEILPKNRKLMFFTYGEPKDYEKYPSLNGWNFVFPVENKLRKRQIVEEITNKIIDSIKLQTMEPPKTEKKATKELFHVAKNTPSDYYLEYAVIDEEGNDAAEHFTFFLEKAYSHGDSFMRLNMVVDDWNDAFCECHKEKSKEENSLLDIPYEISHGNKELCKIIGNHPLACYQKFKVAIYKSCYFLSEEPNPKDPKENPREDEKTWCYYATQQGAVRGYTNNGGKAEICSPAQRLTATISFFDLYTQFNGDAPTTMNFDVTINLIKKDVIKYTMKDKGTKLKISFLRPVPRDVDIRVVYSREGIPYCGADGADRSEDIRITKGSTDIEVDKIETRDDKNHYRIGITNDDESNWKKGTTYIVFQYVGDDCAKQESTKRMFDSGSKRTCLYCALPVHALKGKSATVVTIKDNNLITDKADPNERKSLKQLFRKGEISCEGGWGIFLSRQNTIKSDRKRFLCSRNNFLGNGCFVLPKKYEKKYTQNAVVALLGASGAGKSTFISRFFNIASRGADNVPERAIGKGQVADAMSAFLTIEDIKYDTTANVNKTEFNKAVNKMNSAYSLSPYREFVKRTVADSETSSMLRQLPFILKASHKGVKIPSYIAFYDVPGGDLYNTNPEGGFEAVDEVDDGEFAHHHANCAILFVNDGDDKSNIEKTITDIPAAAAILEGYIGQYKKIKNKEVSKEKRIKDVALAVVLCQFDRIESTFDINSNVRQTAPSFNVYSYKRSKLSEYIERCSQEIESYLKNIDERSRSFFDQLDMFEHIKFFTVSSIGHSQAINKDKNHSQATKFVSNPRNMEYVFAWLMYQTGIID